MEVKKQKTLSLKDSFIRQMEKDILSGRLSVGQKLPSERELAERFAVSKAVIHAGILEMEENGFVLVRPRVGTFVSDFRMDGGKETLLSLMNHDGGSLCAEEVKSFNEFHCALDNMVILLSEHRMDTENYKKLDRAVEGIRDSQNPVEAADYNFRFVLLVSGRACGRCAPTRKLRKHAGAENQNKRGLCVSGYFPLGRSPLFACYDFLKKDV